MDFITIFQAILRWGIPAFIGGIVFFLLSIMIYLIYKKVFHGKKERGTFFRFLDKDELIEESTVDEKSMNRKYNFNLRFKHVDY